MKSWHSITYGRTYSGKESMNTLIGWRRKSGFNHSTSIRLPVILQKIYK